jgi:hypothetical protein
LILFIPTTASATAPSPRRWTRSGWNSSPTRPPTLDFFGDSGRKLKDLVGDKGQHLGTAYNKVAIKTEAKQRGYAITEEVLPSGKIKLTATQYGGI